MIEGILADYLNSYLEKYIQDLNSENLNVGIFNGKNCFYNLTVYFFLILQESYKMLDV